MTGYRIELNSSPTFQPSFNRKKKNQSDFATILISIVIQKLITVR